MFVQGQGDNLKIFKKNIIFLSEKQENKESTLEWEWILIIVLGCFLLVVFIGFISNYFTNIVYEWVYKPTTIK